MRAKLGIGVAVVVAAIAATVIMGVQGATGQSNVHVFFPLPVRLQVINNGRPGLALGDRLAAKTPLLDSQGGDRVGKAYGDCVVMGKIAEPNKGLYWCKYILKLQNGTIVIEGLDPHGPGDYVFAVTGGTGSYAGATGEAALTDSSAGTDMDIHLS